VWRKQGKYFFRKEKMGWVRLSPTEQISLELDKNRTLLAWQCME
jgi:hypothetical protein